VGDVRTHQLIYETFIRPHLPDDGNQIYVELGNYLTDVSQFRDPWAGVGGKASIWEQNVGAFTRYTLLADIVGADGYFDLLLGKPDGDDPQGRRRVPHGLLAQWFREVIYVYSLERHFRDGSTYLIDPDEFKRVYDRHFTQYFPHEHLDYQPLPNGRLDRFEQSAETTPGGDRRRIVDYLDRHIEYVGDLLTKIEHDWARSGTLSGPSLHDVLVRFGHACHALEDFFFHSNFVDLASAIQRGPNDPVPRFDPAEVRDNTDPTGDRIPGRDSVRWDRIDYRRRRQPVFKEGGDGETEFDDEKSRPADIVFTSSIPIPDIFHTFFDAISHLSEHPKVDRDLVRRIKEACEGDAPVAGMLAVVGSLGPNGILTLPEAFMATFVPGEDEFDPATDEARRRRKEARQLRREAHDAYRCLIEHDVLTTAIRSLENQGMVHRSVTEAVAEASRIERTLWDDLPGIADDDSGAARFMMLLLEEGRDQIGKAAKRSSELDDQNREEIANDTEPKHRSGYDASDNDSSAERIGTHSLMSKDSIRKQPLRRQAINGAGFLVSHVTQTMLAQADPSTRSGDGVDWQQLIRHFLTHPEQAETATSQWWRDALEWDRDETNRPASHHVPVAATAALVAERRQEKRRPLLERDYNDLVAEGERRYRHVIATDWVVGSMVWGGLFGAGFGLAGSWEGSPGHKVGGTLLGAAGGMATGAVVSGIGTAVDDRVGSVIGLSVGMGAASAVGYALGHAAKGI